MLSDLELKRIDLLSGVCRIVLGDVRQRGAGTRGGSPGSIVPYP